MSRKWYLLPGFATATSIVAVIAAICFHGAPTRRLSHRIGFAALIVLLNALPSAVIAADRWRCNGGRRHVWSSKALGFVFFLLLLCSTVVFQAVFAVGINVEWSYSSLFF